MYKISQIKVFIVFLIFMTIFLKNSYIYHFDISKINAKDKKFECLQFDTLIAFPDKAFNNYHDKKETPIESKLTTYEFKKILEELYKNNYLIINPEDIFKLDHNQNLHLNLTNLPSNKTPIILTFDNVTYSSNYKNIGEIDKIIIDRYNNIATYTTKKSIQDRIQYDNEFVVILENFISTHPDFSHNNARGIIFLTGNNGILGYNTCKKNADYKNESRKVSEVIFKLKSLGWKFGCNNYTYEIDTNIDNIIFAKNISLWNNEVSPLIGDTKFFAYPYGICDKNNSFKTNLLLDNNFRFFFTSDQNNQYSISKNSCYISRTHINTNIFLNNKTKTNHLFNKEVIYDYINRQSNFDKITT